MSIKLLTILLFGSLSLNAQVSYLENDINKVIEGKRAKVGVSIMDLSSGDRLSIWGDDRFPMQSVFKLHLSLFVLHKVDQGLLNLNDTIHFDKSELYDNTWSPIRNTYPNGASLPLSEVIRYTLAQSDNIGCDKLLSIVGGAGKLNKYIHGIGIEDVNIENNEIELQSSWSVQFNNWTTPNAAIQLLELINQERLLSKESQQFLWQTMLGTSTGSIRNNLPKNAQVAYKTGSSGQNSEGITAANNSIGIMILPNGRKVAYAIFITSSKESNEVNYSIIAEVGKLIYNK